jgi:hypothetical protein
MLHKLVIICFLLIFSCQTNKKNQIKDVNQIDTLKIKADHIRINDTVIKKDSFIKPTSIN